MITQVGTATALSIVSLAAAAPLQARHAAQDPGRLSGATQISYGCPGPQRDGEMCERWSSFPLARFHLTKVGGTTTRTITSDRRGRFTLLLAVGRYRITPLRQAHTNGGAVLTVTVQSRLTSWVRVRFEGFPRML